MRIATLACAAGLLVVAAGNAYGTAVLTTNPTGFTNEVNLPLGFGSLSPFTDANGNTATLEGEPAFVIEPDSSATFSVTFAHPVVKAGFDIHTVGVSEGPFELSNGDSTSASSCFLVGEFCGVTDKTPFTSFSIMVTTAPAQATSDTQLLDFRYTPVPEPASGTLMAPLLIAGLAALMLKKRAQ